MTAARSAAGHKGLPYTISQNHAARLPVDAGPPSTLELAETSGQGEATLVGNQCTRCGTTFFPAHALCTSCLTDRFLEPARLSRQGTVYAWTVVYQSLPEFQVPYVLAYVDFPENVRVLAQVRDVTPEQMRTGLAVEVLRVPTSPRDGAAYWNVQGFAFRPVEDEQEVAHG